MSEPTVLLVAALAAVVGAMTLRARRAKTTARFTALAGSVLLLASLAVGLLLLPERDAPAELSGAIGVLPPPPVLPRPGRGFAVALATQVDGCENPVSVTLLTAGTGEYWADYRAETRGLASGAFPFVLVLPGEVTGVLRVGLASKASDITDPSGAQFGHTTEIKIQNIVRGSDRTIIAGTVSDWPRTLLPLLARFQANWLAPRGLSTCYLRLPSLSGSQTATSVVAAVGGCDQINADYRGRACHPFDQAGATAYVGALLTSHGTSIVSVRSGEVSPALSVPPPPGVVGGKEAWTCGGRPDTIGRFSGRSGVDVPDIVGGSEGGAAYSLGAIEGSAGESCRAVAVITENSAAYSRDLLILVIGAVMGLGVTLIVQAIIDTFANDGARDRGPARPPAAGPSAPTPDHIDKPTPPPLDG